MKKMMIALFVLMTLSPFSAYSKTKFPHACPVDPIALEVSGVFELQTQLFQHWRYYDLPISPLVALLKARNSSVIFGGYAESLANHAIVNSGAFAVPPSALNNMDLWLENIDEEVCEMEICFSLQEIL